MIDADPDVLDAQQGVLPRNPETAFRLRHDPFALVGLEDLQMLFAIGELDLVKRRERRVGATGLGVLHGV